jgi:hypothetical protein
MNADGTRPRRLARGHCPSWKEDSTCIYYHSWVDRALYSISVTASEAEPPRWIAPCSTFYPSLSPNGQRFAYVEGRSLKVMDLASQTPLAQWQFPFPLEGGLAWSPKGDELSVGNRSVAERRAGLWICRFGHKEPIEILDGQVDAGSWSAQGKKLAFNPILFGTAFAGPARGSKRSGYIANEGAMDSFGTRRAQHQPGPPSRQGGGLFAVSRFFADVQYGPAVPLRWPFP